MSRRRKGSRAVKLPLDELKQRAWLALDSPALVKIAFSTNSPTEAFEKAYLRTTDARKSMACKNLARIKRDYGREAFDIFVSAVASLTKSIPAAQGQDKEQKEV